MHRYIFAEILVITAVFLFPSGTHGVFSDIQRRAESLCSLAIFKNIEAVECEGVTLDLRENKYVLSGKDCIIKQGNIDRHVKCKVGIWHDIEIETPKIRVKRGWWRRRRRRRRSPPPPPPNRPPTVTCPDLANQHHTDARTKTKIVTWGSATATDPENNPITITKTHRWDSGDVFDEGQYSIGYRARDSHGNADVCSKEFEIKVRRCLSMPPRPDNGEIRCEPDWYDPLLGSTCTFSCDHGYALEGSKIRTCQNDGFDGTPAVCSLITCPELQNPENGQAICTNSNLYNSVCITSCQENMGYSSESTFIMCRDDGTWSGFLPPCYDYIPPYFTSCPPNPIKAYADRGQNSAVVTWSSVTASDNSGNVTIVRTLGAAPGSEFTVGSHSISYVARDDHNNQSPTTCSFTVVVEQLECNPPIGLFDDELLQVDCPGTEYTYGIQCQLSCIRNYTIIGNTTLTCEREGTTSKTLWDWGGGTQPECDDKCPDLTPPLNGALICQTASNYYCRQSCNANYGYPRGVAPGKLFICTTYQVWDPPVVDDCTGRKVPDSNIISGEIHYFVGDCSDTAVQEGLKTNFITVLEDMISSGWSNVCSSSGCSVDDVVISCGAVSRRKRKSVRDIKHKQPSEQSRYERSTSTVVTIDFSITFPWQNGTSDADLIANDDLLFAVVAALEEEAKKPGGRLVYEGLAPLPDIVTDVYPTISCPTGEIPSYAGGGVNCEGCATGKYYDSTRDDCTVCPMGTYQNESHQTTCKACPTDMSTKHTQRKAIGDCFQVCNAGSYSSNGVIPCTKCDIGSYQSNKNSTGCISCDVAKTTVSRGESSSSACVGFDVIFGSPATNITFPNLAISLTAFSLMFWMQCPSGNIIRPTISLVNSVTTTTVLQITDSQTLEMFGTAYPITFEIWKHVTITWEQSTGQVQLLINGENSASITTTGSIGTAGTRVEIDSNNGNITACRISGFWMTDTKRSDAQIMNDVQTCTPDTTGAVYNMDNFKNQDGVILDTPSKCDVVDECAALPCGVHNCENLLNSYKCNCIGGYTGLNCETAPNFCLSNTCKNSAICQNQAWNYTCQCVGDFRGELCDETIVHGQWAEWRSWSKCTASCDGGQQTRNRTCSDPPPGPDGNACSGNDQEMRGCNADQCPSCTPIGVLLLGFRKVITDHCETQGDYTRCNLTCEAGYDFSPSTPPLDYYECGANTSYEWNGQPLSCGRISGARDITVRASGTYLNTLPCGSATDTALQSSAGNVQCMLDSTCSVTIVTDACGNRRRKRTTGTTVEMSFVFNLENIGELNLTAFLESNIISAELQAYLNVLSQSDDTEDQLNSTYASVFDVIINGVTYTIDPDTFKIDGHSTCNNGSIDDGGGCVECPTGTRQDGAWCVLCDIGTYQNESGQVVCKQCPIGFTTEFQGMPQEENCSVVVTSTTVTSSITTSSVTSITSTTTATITTTTSVPTTTATTTLPTPSTTTTTTTSVPTTTTSVSTTTTSVPTTTTSVPTTTTSVPTTTTSVPTTTTSVPTTTTSVPTTTTSVPTTTTSVPTTTTSVPTTTKLNKLPNRDQSEGLSLVAVIVIGVLAVLVLIVAVIAGGMFIYRQRKPVSTTSPSREQHRRGIDLNIEIHSNVPNTITVAETGLPPPYTTYPSQTFQKGGIISESSFAKPLPRKSPF